MNTTASITREYLKKRIEHYTKEIDNTEARSSFEGKSNGVLIWQYKSIRTELEQTLKVLDGGQSIFPQAQQAAKETAEATL